MITETAMLRRLGYVLLNYATRPMVWVLGGFYLVALIALMFDAAREFRSHRTRSIQRAYPSMEFSGRSVKIIQNEEVLEFDRGKIDAAAVNVEIQWPSVFATKVRDHAGTERMEIIDGPTFSAKHLRQLKSCKKLRALTLRQMRDFDDETLEALGEMDQLESLSLIGCLLKSSFWNHLGRLPKLRNLDISGCNLWLGGYPDLESLTHLETLIVGSIENQGIIENFTPFLPELRRIPRLKMVVLGNHYISAATMQKLRASGKWNTDHSPPTSTTMIPAAINDLGAISTLQTLFVFETQLGYPDFDELNRKLPGVVIRPSYVDGNRPIAILGVLWLHCILLFLLSLQIHSQFSQPAARLVPNYAWPHLVPIVCLWMFSLAIHSVPLVARRVAIGPALGVNLLLWFTLLGIGGIGLMGRTAAKPMRWFAFLVAIISFAYVPILIALFQWKLSSLDWYLRGSEPLWTSLFIVSGLCIAIEIVRRVPRLHSMYLERGVQPPPLSLDPIAFADWQQNLGMGRTQPWNLRIMSSWLDRIIDRAKLPGWHARCKLWIAGNAGNGYTAIPLALAVIIGGGSVYGIANSANYEWPIEPSSIQNPGVFMMTIFVVDIPMFVLGNIWRTRRRLFGVESLRPVSREEFARQIAVAMAWDMIPLAYLYLAVLALYTIGADPQLWTPAWTAVMLLFFAARWLFIYGLFLWGIAIRRNWVAMLIGFISIYAIAAVNVIILMFQGPVLGIRNLPSDLPHIGLLPLMGMVLLYGMVGSAVVYFAYRRWKWVELA